MTARNRELDGTVKPVTFQMPCCICGRMTHTQFDLDTQLCACSEHIRIAHLFDALRNENKWLKQQLGILAKNMALTELQE